MALAEYLQCGICFEPYTAGSRVPKFLQCAGGIQHTYCLECLRRLTVDGRIKCPCCGDMTQLAARGTADALMNNIYLLPQIEAAQAAAAAARTKNGLEMFCKTCTSMASDKCGEHELLKMSELRDALRQLAQRGAESMETVRRRRAELVALFREAHAVLVSVSESVRHTIEDYEMDVQLDDNIVSELERKREAAEALPADQLVDSYRLTEQHATDAAAALRETDTLEAQCRALLAASVTLSAGGANGSGEAFPVGEWLRSGDLMQALLAASVVVYSLDHVTGADEQEAAGEDDCHKPGAESAPTAAAAAAAPALVQNGANGKTTEKCANGDVGNSKSKPSAKSTPSVNGKTSEKSSKSTTAATTKTTVSASAAKVSSSQSASAAKVSSSQSASAAKVSSSQSAPASKGTTPAKVSDAGKSAKPSASAPKDKSASATVTSTKVTALSITKVTVVPTAAPTTKASTTKQPDTATSATNSADAAARSAFQAAVAAATVPPSKPKPAPSFSSMVKSSAGAAVPEPAVKPTVKRPLRGAHPFYALQMTDGTNKSDVIVELRPDMAPVMVRNFIMLCDGGFLNNTKFHFAVHSDYLLGGRVDDDEGFSPLAQKPDKFVMADQCPLQDECGAIRMKGMGTVTGAGGEKRGLIGSQFMMWVSETRDYRQYQYTLVFGFIRQGLDFVRHISSMERQAIWRNARLLTARPHKQ